MVRRAGQELKESTDTRYDRKNHFLVQQRVPTQGSEKPLSGTTCTRTRRDVEVIHTTSTVASTDSEYREGMNVLIVMDTSDRDGKGGHNLNIARNHC
jgi:hypothetical protein